ncbi:flagellar export chaperone FliS [Heliophilum fasciatum]|nr:flagellar export chaperone FliS [Heliophilum fasciatum]MCW2278801.1 flagellar protein FliS [Heliophilum fasciatum]
MMQTAHAANTYAAQKVMTCAKEDLPTMLYGGAVRFINQSLQAIEQGNLQEAHIYNLRAQDIVQELMITLDMQVEISKSLMSLYDYIQYRLIQGNIKKDKESLIEARDMIQELRETWVEAVKIARKERGGAAHGVL